MNPFPTSEQKNSSADGSKKNSPLSIILQQEDVCLSQVLNLLTHEHDAILSRETDIMGSLLDKKTHLLSKLSQLEQQRQNIFEKSSGQTYSTQSFSLYIEQDTDITLLSIWQNIKEQLSQCKTQNEINGKIINHRKENTEQILQLLLGRPANNPQTYSHLGQTQLQKRSALYTSV